MSDSPSGFNVPPRPNATGSSGGAGRARARRPAGTGHLFVLPKRAGEGERTSVLVSFASSMRSAGLERESFEDLLLAYNAEHCHPPLTDAEVRTIARSIARVRAMSERKHNNPQPEVNPRAGETTSRTCT